MAPVRVNGWIVLSAAELHTCDSPSSPFLRSMDYAVHRVFTDASLFSRRVLFLFPPQGPHGAPSESLTFGRIMMRFLPQ